MKKMLDELKKLDVEYEVPQDFRKKVMEQIKAEANNKKKQSKKNKVIHLKRYVIACASVAAMFIVVVNVTGMGDKFAMQENASVAMDSMNSMNSVNYAPSTSETENLKGYDVNNSIMDGLISEDKVAMDNETNRAESATTEIPSATQKEKLSLKHIEELLKDSDINYEIVEKKLFISKEDLQKVKDTIEKEILEDLEFVEKEDKIQIIIK